MEVTIDSLRSELDQIETPVLEEAGLVDRIGPRRTSALDMTSMRRYNMMREWIGERDMSHDRRVFKSRIYTRKFEDSISIPIEDIEDRNLANFDPGSEAEGLRMSYEDRVAFEQHAWLVHAMDDTYHGGQMTGKNGEIIFSGSLDGKALLSDEHPYFEQIEFDGNAAPGQQIQLTQGGTFSNLVNDDLTQENLWKAILNFRTMKDYRGRPANYGRPNMLIVGPEYEEEANEILDDRLEVKTVSGEGVTAVDNSGRRLNLDVMVNDWLYGEETIGELNFDGSTYTDEALDAGKFWFLVTTRPNRKPFVFWNRKSPEIQRPVGSPDFTSENPAEGAVDYFTFRDDAAVVGARARFGMSFGVPQVIYGSLGGQTLGA
jgi:phage major head subunit gpT-like protein